MTDGIEYGSTAGGTSGGTGSGLGAGLGAGRPGAGSLAEAVTHSTAAAPSPAPTPTPAPTPATRPRATNGRKTGTTGRRPAATTPTDDPNHQSITITLPRDVYEYYVGQAAAAPFEPSVQRYVAWQLREAARAALTGQQKGLMEQSGSAVGFGDQA